MRRTISTALCLVGLMLPGDLVRGESGDSVLTLERALEIAETSNHQARAAAARLEEARAEVASARSRRLPRLELESSYHRSDNPTIVFSNLLSQGRFGPENFEIGQLNRPDPLDHWSARFLLYQPLWAGGSLAATERGARYRRDAVVAGRERTLQEVKRQVTDRYTAAVVAAHEVRVATDTLATAEAHVRLADDLYRAGLVVESDLLSAQVRAGEVREMSIRAESALLTTLAALSLALGQDPSVTWHLPETLEPEERALRGLDELVEIALDRRPDLLTARLQGAAADTGIEVAKADRRPRIGMTAAYEIAAEDVFGNDGDHWTVGVGIQVPVFDGFGSRARIALAEARAQEAAVTADLVAKTVALEVRQAFHALEAARRRLEPAETGVRLADRGLEIVTDRYKEGLVELTTLLDAEAALTAARFRRLAARRDVLLAATDLDLATGEL